MNADNLIETVRRRGVAAARACAGAVAGVWAWSRQHLLIVAPIYSLALLGLGVLAGDWASDAQIASRVRAALSQWQEKTDIGQQDVVWAPLPADVALHDFEFVSIDLAPFDTFGRGGALEEIEGNIIFASPLGTVAYLSRDAVLTPLDVRAPMNLEALQQHPISEDPAFEITQFRTLDLLAVQTGPGAYDLYVSHHRFNDGCFEVVVSRMPVRVENGAPRAASDAWDEVFVATPCVAPIDFYTLWVGEQSGGRMAMRNETTLLLTLGDQFLDGIHSETAVSQDPSVDLGKIIAINVVTKESRIFASGLRNPQGLCIARDGTIWETEHGPEGGDEINLIEEGRNYGWPNVTYGADYGGRRRNNWPFNPVQGRHDGYAKPAFAFVPSVGISNIVQPDPREFPLWRDHLIVASLNGNSLFVVRVEDGGRIIYAEPARIEGKRIRDMIVLDDGRMALLTDDADLILLRNQRVLEGQVSPREASFVVTAAPGVEVVDPGESNLHAYARGELLFAEKCGTCHNLSGAVAIGPPLNAILGKPIGTHPGFDYSPALAQHGDAWNDRNLTEFLTDPEQNFPGTSMPRVALNRDEAYAVTAYLSGN